jgi:hypothetical protein
LLAPALAAQTSAPSASPFRFVPKDAVLVAQADGLAKWPERFAGTNAGKLAENELFRLLLAPFGDGAERFRAEAKRRFGYDLGPSLDALRAYSGRATLFLHCPFREAFETVGQDALDGALTPATWGIVLEPDGKTDLAKLAQSCRELRKAAGDKVEEKALEAGGRRWTCVKTGGSRGSVLLPELDQGQLVAFAGTDLDAQLPKLCALPKERRLVPDPTAGAAGLWARFTLTPALSAFAEWTQKEGTPAEAKRAWQIMKKLGLASVDALELRAEPAGKHVRAELAVSFHGAPAGICAALAPDPDDKLTLHELVPPGITTFSAGSMRWAKLFAIVLETVEEFGDTIGVSRDEIEDGFEQETGVKLREELLDPLGAEHMMLGTVIGPMFALALAGLADDPLDELGFVYAVRLKDGATFAAAIEKLVRKQGLHAARKTSEHSGVKVHELPISAMLPSAYAVAPDLALLALGKKGKEQLVAVLGERAARADKKARQPFPAAIEKRLAQLPGAFQGLQVVDLGPALAAAEGSAVTALAARSPGKSQDECQKVWAEFRAALKSLDLEHVVATEHSTRAKVAWIALW